MDVAKKRTFKVNLLKCKDCGYEMEYGLNGWAFSTPINPQHRKLEDFDEGHRYHVMSDHSWQKIGEKEIPF
ncbi:hypothetical protein C4565_00660 [Candidatus Parcubacteria bacterium]|nr:MAG: hypothetical protein C4565_00660 [Candidatus Parcubacteria bacterium]